VMEKLKANGEQAREFERLMAAFYHYKNQQI
jgi:hypothetical protein